jgi:hypothetical protein
MCCRNSRISTTVMVMIVIVIAKAKASVCADLINVTSKDGKCFIYYIAEFL